MAVEDQELGGGFLGKLPPQARLGIIVGGVILLVGLFAFVFMRGSEEKDDGFRTVYRNLPPAEAGNARDYLEQMMRIEVKLADNGTSLRVPKDKAEEALVKLAQNSMPTSGQVGFEIFDKGSFISTDFEKQVSLRRAMNGELSRIIKRFEGVEDARVNIVVPEPQLFSEEQLPTTASVLIDFAPGGGFKPENVESVTHLIASAVPGLKPENVTIVDTAGLMLASGQAGLGGDASKKQFHKQLAEQMTMQRQMEQRLEYKVVAMLEKVLGPGNVKATVSSVVDFDRVQQRKRLQEPVVFKSQAEGKPIEKPMTVTERKITETNVNGGGAGATAGAVPSGTGGNQDPAPPAGPPNPTAATTTAGGENKGSSSTRTNEQSTFNYNTTEELITNDTGIMLSKAIAVQFQVPKKAGAGEGEEAAEEGEEGGPKKMTPQDIEEMVKAAINFNGDKDQISVKEVQLDTTVYDTLQSEMEKARKGTPIWIFILIGLGGLVVGAGVGGALLGKKKAAAAGAEQFGAMPGAPQYAAIPPAGEGGGGESPGGAPALPEQQAQEVTRAPVMPPMPDNPFGFLQGVTPETVAKLLSTERLPTLVAVLAQLEPNQAEDVITLLNPEIQNEVRNRLAQNPVLPPMTQKMVSQSLKKRLASLSAGVS